MDYGSAKHVVTYNPAYVEQHSDSTDFDDYSTTRSKNQHKRKKPFVKKTRAEKEYSITRLQDLRNVEKRNTLHKKYTMNSSSSSICHHCGTTLKNCAERRIPKISQQDRYGANAAPGISRVNILKNKISSILFGTNRRLSPFVKSGGASNCKVYCADCRRRHMSKNGRRHGGYAPRSLYLVEDVPRDLMNIQTEAHDSYHVLARESVSYTSVLWSDSETELSKDKLYRRRKDDEFDMEIKKEHLKFRIEKELKSRSQQYSRHDMYQVFATQNQYCQAESSRTPRLDSATALGNGLPATASGFWEFLVNKLNARYQEAKSLPGSLRCCQSNCEKKAGARNQNSESQTPPAHSLFENSSNQRSKFNFNSVLFPGSAQNGLLLSKSGKKSPTTSIKSSAPLSVACECKPEQINQAEHGKKSEVPCECNPDQINQAERVKKSEKFEKSEISEKAEKSEKSDLACECNPDLINQAERILNSEPKSTQVNSTGSKSCQEPHDAITKVLKEKYKGEVLCIHNPPCVLINGCLNVPQQPAKSTPVSTWPAMTTQLKMSSYLSGKKNKKAKIKKSEQASQYHPPYGELQQYSGDTVAKADKLMQSICSHNPPCQVVPGCFKPNYDPQLVNSCVHVPMCNKKIITDCFMEVEQGESLTGNHKPTCFEVPESSRNYTVARGEVFTHAKAPAGMACVHRPPCLMVPLCQARVLCDSVMPYQDTLDCVHQPPCALVPACFRKYVQNAVSTIRLPFNKGLNIRISREPICQNNKQLKMVNV